jgi:hypothetical protein
MAVKLISHEINFSDLVYSSVWQEVKQKIAIWEGNVPEKHHGCLDESLTGNFGVIRAMPPANLSGGSHGYPSASTQTAIRGYVKPMAAADKTG